MELVIFIDTNVLYYALDYSMHIDSALKHLIHRNFRVYIHESVEKEILNALTLEGKIARQAKFAMELIQNYTRYEDPREYPGADVALYQSARRVNGIIFTFDKELKQRCLSSGIPVISHHAKGKLQLFGYLK